MMRQRKWVMGLGLMGVVGLVAAIQIACRPLDLPGPKTQAVDCLQSTWPLLVQEAVQRRDPTWPEYASGSIRAEGSYPGKDGTFAGHPDFEVVHKEWIRSKRFGWRLKIPYGPSRILFENEGEVLIQAFHSFDDGNSIWTPFGDYFYLIDKQHGTVSKRLEVLWRKDGHPSTWFEGRTLYILDQQGGPSASVVVKCMLID